ncbi:MAG: hypothetical protein KDB86_01855 [Actinobacteria bacterium]|nr:hypothetical protein [Actinomycetota bacterium]MCB9390909.1 hypothetical protein [Acidimicrobiia bacterium]
MKPTKKRLTITVDSGLAQAAADAVRAGDADSVSSWVSLAIDEKVQRDRLIKNLGAAIADFESEFGEITPEEIAKRRRADRRDAVVVRGTEPKSA